MSNNSTHIIKIHRKATTHGSLIIIGMPIGNFDDLSPRALLTLKKCQLILCEDTRSNKLLFEHFSITGKQISYVGSYSEAIKMATRELEINQDVALICDRGMVGISDPGAKIVSYFRNRGISIDCIPGPSSLTTAFALSGYFGNFIFHGFLPRTTNEILSIANILKNLDYNLIFFESPNRLYKSLKILEDVFSERQITIAKELTKTYQDLKQGTISEILEYAKTIKGECVIIIQK